MRGIAKKTTPINVIFYYPKTEEAKRELADRVADIHADTVDQYIKKINCPSEQKIKLLNAVIEIASKNRDESSI